MANTQLSAVLRIGSLNLPVPILIAAHFAVWFAYGAEGLRGGIHDDMAEAWAWGKELQLGYYKHPPLFAWLAGAWFYLLPREDAWFQLLAALNGAVGVGAVWLLAREIVGPCAARTAAILAMLSPVYGPLALKFNANAILMALWPLLTLALLRSLRDRRAGDAVLLGMLGGLAMLGKYYSILLLAACFVATLLHPIGSLWWRSASPWLATATGLLTVMPHVWWLATSGFPTFRYAGTKFAFTWDQLILWAVVTAMAPLLFFTLALSVLLLAARARPGDVLRACVTHAQRGEHRWLWAIALLPFLFTLAIGMLGHAKVSISYTFPIFFLWPILLVAANPGLATLAVTDRCTLALAAMLMLVACTAPAIGRMRTQLRLHGAVEPRAEAAVALEQAWRDRFGVAPRLVAGSMAYAGSMSFYAPGAPSHFIHFQLDWAPWVKPADIVANGLLVVCETSDLRCLSHAKAWTGTQPQLPFTVRRGDVGTAELTVWMLPPENWTSRLVGDGMEPGHCQGAGQGASDWACGGGAGASGSRSTEPSRIPSRP